MGAKGGYKPDDQPEIAGLTDEFSNSQEVIPVPIIAGERLVPLKWITRIYKPYTKEAPMERPGKK